MTRSRCLPAILTLLVAAGISWGQKTPPPNPVAPYPVQYPDAGGVPYFQQLPEVLFPPQPRSYEAARDGEACDEGDMVSLLVTDCLRTWALLWENGKYAEAGTMADEACRLEPKNDAAEYARALSQLANHTRFVHPAAGCPCSCYAVPSGSMDCAAECCESSFATASAKPSTPAKASCPGNGNPCCKSSPVCKPTKLPSTCPGAETCENPYSNAPVSVNECPACQANASAKKGCACGAKPVSAKASCGCGTKCCSAKETCACDNNCCTAKTACKCKCCSSSDACSCQTKCCADQEACCCATKCCCTTKAAKCCKNCVSAKQSCSCCTNCSCGKNSSLKVSEDNAANCTFLRMLQGLPHMQGQPSHPIVIMHPTPTPAHMGLPTGFLPPMPNAMMPHPMMPHPFMGNGHPAMPMMMPPPNATENMHDHFYIPVARPQFPMFPPQLMREAEQELVPPPTVVPPSMPLQITAAGKRVKVSCPRFDARCDRINHLPSGDRIVLEGKVRLTFRGKDAGKVSAERVEVDTIDGAVEVNPAPVPARPVVPVGYYSPVTRPTPPLEP
jgi:hypothetical protein